MKKAPVSRRTFLGSAATAGAGLCLSLKPAAAADKPAKRAATAAAARGATDWPKWDDREEQALLDVLRSGKWGRGNGTKVTEFEQVFAERMRAKYCIATASGTTALLSAIGALNVGPGDEVILPPYTFVATFNVITASFSLPVFADVDAASFQIDPAKLEAAITPATRLLLPVHIGGSTCELDAIADIAARRRVPMIEDAAQAPGAEWRGQPVGTKGIGGCFSFQASKNLTSGEGGAVVTNDEAFAHQVYNFHTPGTPKSGTSWGRAANYRLTEFQAALLLAQYSRFNAQQDYRNANAEHLSDMLRKIPGIAPAKLASGNNRSAWHLYMFRYDAAQFANLPRAKFLKALAAEGIPASGGYSPLNRQPFLENILNSRGYQRLYGPARLKQWREQNELPVNDRLCNEAVWFTQTMLLGDKRDMEDIAAAIAKVHQFAATLATSSTPA